jgi:hypothetical protein
MKLALAIPFFTAAALAQTLTPVEVTTTDNAELTAGGTIHLVGSEGELNIEAGDGPAVEVRVSRYTERGPKAKDRDEAKRTLEGIRVEMKKTSANEVTVTTTIAARNELTRRLRGLNGVDIDYRIRVPKDAKLVIEHGSGDIVIAGVAGGIQAKSKNGEIYVFLPGKENYSIKAKAKLGTVYSEFDGARKHEFPFGSSFAGKGAAPAKEVILETRTGGVTVQKSTEF